MSLLSQHDQHNPLYSLPTSLSFLTSPSLLLPLLFTLTILYYTIRHFVEHEHHPKPPSPPRLPIIGNLHQLGSLPHRSLKHLADVYGPLILLKLGQIPVLVVSSPSLAKQVLKTDDAIWCARPVLSLNQRLSYGCLDLAFHTDLNEWQRLRKLTNLEFFNSKRVQSFIQSAREREIDTMMEIIARASEKGEAVNLTEILFRSLSNVTSMMLFGKRTSVEGECEKYEVGETAKETMKMLGEFMVGDFFPCMKNVVNVLFGVQRRIDRICKRMDELLEGELKEREEKKECIKGDDFASVLMRLHMDGALSRDNVKALLMDIVIAGSDTSIEVVIFAMSQLIKNPRVLSKVQAELHQVVKGKNRVKESDLQHLKYLNAIVKEVFRLHPPSPILVRESREACNLGRYPIKPKRRLYINVWAIGRDPNSWSKANEFWPERFEESSVEYKGHHFEFIPFGSGRRNCPGSAMGALLVGLTLANILYKFNWSLPNGIKKEDIDMAECSGLVISLKDPLLLVATLVY